MYPIGVVAVALASAVLAPQAGTLALAGILVPHLCLAAVVLVPAAVLLRNRVLSASLVFLAPVTVVRFGPEWVSLPRDAGDRDVLTVATWNLLSGGTDPDRAVAEVLATDAQVVALQGSPPTLQTPWQATSESQCGSSTSGRRAAWPSSTAIHCPGRSAWSGACR